MAIGRSRLIKQYAMKKSFYGWTDATPPTLDLQNVTHVLDIAAGTCVWTFDLANTPAIKSRLTQNTRGDSKTTPLRLYACDIDTKFFPDKAILDEVGITTFQQDVTKPFPSDLYGKFDVLHISFLVICLTTAGWEAALKNCYELLSMFLS